MTTRKRPASRFGIILCICAILCASGCEFQDELGRERYRVVERQDDPRCTPYRITCKVHVVLAQGNRRLYASALDYKGDVGGEVRHCDLRVGQTVNCKRFTDPHSEDAGGYDMICGGQLWHGRLTTTSRNEMLTIKKEEFLP
jgi:hypothetical protein